MADTDSNLQIIEESRILVERNQENNWIDLSDQDKAFAYVYILNGYNHLEAAEEVGIARSGALRTLRKPLVSAFISHLQTENFTASRITKDFVESQYLEILPKLKGEEDIAYVTGMGLEVEVKKFHGSELISVLRDLSKSSGYQKEEEINKSQVNIQMNFGAVMDKPEVIINGGNEEEK